MWNTILINNEQSRILGDQEGVVQNKVLTDLNPFIDYLSTLQKQGTEISLEKMDGIKILNSSMVGFVPLPNEIGNSPQFFQWDSLNTQYIENLANNIINNL